MRVLDRGYAIAFSSAGESIRSIKQIKTGQKMRVKFADGEVKARVDEGGA